MTDRSWLLAPGVQLLSGEPQVVTGEAGDVLRVKARVLTSETFLHDSRGRWLMIPEAVLKAAVDLWPGAPLKLDHDRSVLSTVGRVVSVSWADATADVPGGVDAEIEVNRGLGGDAETLAKLLESGLVRNLSSGFLARWEKSHPELSDDEFLRLYGQDVDGRRVCEVATEISEVDEVSWVDRGGDPYSRRLRASGGSEMAESKKVELAGKALDEKSFVSALMALVGVGLDTSLEDLLGAVGKVLQGKDPGEKKPEPEDEPKEKPEPKPEAMPPAMESAALSRLLSALSPEGVQLASVDEAVAEVIRLRTEMVPRAAAPSQVAVALAEGRIEPHEQAALLRFEKTDPMGLKAYLSKRPANSAVPTGPAQSRLSTQTPASEISERVKELAKLAGVKPEAIQERLTK